MNLNISKVPAVLVALCFSIIMPVMSGMLHAQELPTIPQASNVVTGTLSNGVTYYLVSNDFEKGKADVALVQKAGYKDEKEDTYGYAVVSSKGSLATLPHFPSSQTPFSYLALKNIFPSSKGYVSVRDDATIFRFKDIYLTSGREVLDSTLLMVFDIIGHNADGLMPKTYSPSNQAVIVSGGIDPTALLNKMNMLSMLITKKPSETRTLDYNWTSVPDKKVEVGSSPIPGISSVSAVYHSPRTSRDNMNTIQPLVSELFSRQMELLLRTELSKNLNAAHIPVASIDFSYTGSTRTSGDEKYSIEVSTPDGYVKDAVRILSETLSALKNGGVAPDRYDDIQRMTVVDLVRVYGSGVMSNEEYVERCIASYMYGSSVSSAQSIMDFFLKREIDPAIGARLFNNFVSAVIDKSRNLHLVCRTAEADVTPEVVRSVFDSAWKTDSPAFSAAHGKSLKTYNSKTKLMQTMQEPMTGGQTWIFKNGIRVIYKQMPGMKSFQYAWLVKGGYSLMPTLHDGESAHVGNMFNLYSTGDFSSAEFKEYLHIHGIYMEPHVSVSDFTLRGYAPNKQLPLLMKSLVSLARDRHPDAEAFEAYRRNFNAATKEMQFTRKRRQSVLDSLMHPDNIYTDFTRNLPLAADFQQRADKYYSAEFDKMNDGVFIIIGDFDEIELKKTLMNYIGSFHTEKISTFRSRVKIANISSRRTLAGVAPRASLSQQYSVDANYTTENFMAANMAAFALKNRIARVAARHGWTTSAAWSFDIFPQETFNVYVDMAYADPAGMPASMAPTDSVEVLMKEIREATVALGNNGITAVEMDSYKGDITNYMSAYHTHPESVVELLLLRYSYGKDIMTNYQQKVNAVSAANVNALIKGLVSGGIAEYALHPETRRETLNEVALPLPEMVLPSLDELVDTSKLVYPVGLKRLYAERPENMFGEYYKYIKALKMPEVKPFRTAKADSLASLAALADSLASVADSLGMAGMMLVQVDSTMTADPLEEETEEEALPVDNGYTEEEPETEETENDNNTTR